MSKYHTPRTHSGSSSVQPRSISKVLNAASRGRGPYNAVVDQAGHTDGSHMPPPGHRTHQFFSTPGDSLSSTPSTSQFTITPPGNGKGDALRLSPLIFSPPKFQSISQAVRGPNDMQTGHSLSDNSLIDISHSPSGAGLTASDTPQWSPSLAQAYGQNVDPKIGDQMQGVDASNGTGENMEQ
jgi:hypothetical protein